MRTKTVVAALCSLLLIDAPVMTGAAAAAMGKMNASEYTEVNGSSVPSEISIYSGDRIATKKDGVAALFLVSGSRLLLGASSAVQIQNGDGHLTAMLNGGALAVVSRGDKPVFTEAAGTRIHAVRDGGVYEVVVHGNALRVIAHKGTAMVEAADRVVEVDEGKTLEGKTQSSGAAEPGQLSPLPTVLVGVSLAASSVAIGVGIAAIENSKTCRVESPTSITCQ